MLKLIVGLKGTGKTKELIELVNSSAEQSNGCVVCLEKGNKLIHEISNQVRLVDVDEYSVSDASTLYGMVAGMYASNYDITSIFIDSALKICNDNLDEFEKFIDKANAFSEKAGVEMVFTSSIKKEDLPEFCLQFVK